MFFFNEIIAKNQKPRKTKHFDNENLPNASEWVLEFVQRNEWLCVVEESYANDNFNLYGLSNTTENYQQIIKMIRGQFYDYNLNLSENQIRKECESLYGLIHARYLLTFNGVKAMQTKYEKAIFGRCPRVACKRQALLPIGLSPNLGEMKVKTFCPCCLDIYDTNCELDGAFFGPYFPHFFMQALKNDVKFEQREPTKLSYLGVPIAKESDMNRCYCVHE